ncbi:glucosylceramidase [Mucilaginibacter sp. Bleaf8]|nr:glucosylceramidase [Mucilaginibacter sp. Bleaf8]
MFYACKKDIRTANDASATTGANKTTRAVNDVVNAWVTTTDRSKLLQAQPSFTFGATSGAAASTITVDENTTYQGIDGFGYTLTGGSAMLINGMGAAQDALLSELFGTGNNQIGVSYLRLSIGASDLSASSFTYDDMPAGQTDVNLNNFSINAEMKDLIPVLKKILAINPNIKIFGSPWSPPVWMKTNTTGNGGFTGGKLNPAYYDAYARYFVKYIQAMKAQGITIDAVTPQNEPLNPYNNPSLDMQASEQAAFIKNNLGPQLRNAGLSTKIIAYDHNPNRVDYPKAVLADAGANPYVDGSAFHLYEGDINALSDVHNAYPNKNIYFTEQWVGGPGNFGGDLTWHIANVIVGSTRNWSRNALEWNIASDPNYYPHTNGGCGNCLGALTLSGTSVTRNVAYYVIAHASKFVRPGAVRIASNNTGSIQNVAFKNTDGSKVLVAVNTNSASQTFKVQWGSASFTYTLPGGAVATFKWTGSQSGSSGVPVGQTVTLKGINNAFVSGENGTQAMTCTRTTAGDWERFTIVDAGSGKVALQSMGKYVSSENGTQAITCSRTSVGDWEKFDLETTTDGKWAFKGNNGKYISSENGTQAMTCTRSSISGWEAFAH